MLNEMCGISHAMHVAHRPTLSQRLVMDNIREAVAGCGPPPAGLSGREALSALLAKQGYSGGTTAQLDIDLLSLPSGTAVPVPLSTLLGPEGHETVQHFISSSVLPKNAARAKISECEVNHFYMDPLLREDPRAYGKLLQRLHQCGMVEWRRAGTPRVGLFAVQKKAGKQRLIVDARLANCMFTDSRPVHLCSGSTLGSIQMPEGTCLHVGQVDVENAFYNMLLPPELVELFCLPRIKARFLDLDSVEGLAVDGNTYVYPHIRVVPMGFSHALYLCQRVHESAIDRVDSLQPLRRLRDGAAVPPGLEAELVHGQYVDNFFSLGAQADSVYQGADAADAALRGLGLPCHPVEHSAGGQLLGWAIVGSPPTVQTSRKRLWRLRPGGQALLNRGSCSGRELAAFVGNATFSGLVRRECLAVFSAVYAFSDRIGLGRATLWPAVRKEIRWFIALLPLLFRRLDTPWCDVVTCTDASLWGMGVVESVRDLETIAKAGRYNERWRFTRGEEERTTARRAAMAAAARAGEPVPPPVALDVRPEDVPDSSFPEVPPELFGGEWTTVAAQPWRRKGDSMSELELNSLVWAVRRMTRNSAFFNRRVLFLSDSMSAILALAKGRSSSALLRGCRVWSAHVLAFSLSPVLRWIPSEFCAADKASRLHVPEPLGPRMGIHAKKSVFMPGRVAVVDMAEGETRGSGADSDDDSHSAASTAQDDHSPMRQNLLVSDGPRAQGRPSQRKRQRQASEVGGNGIGSKCRHLFGAGPAAAERPLRGGVRRSEWGGGESWHPQAGQQRRKPERGSPSIFGRRGERPSGQRPTGAAWIGSTATA